MGAAHTAMNELIMRPGPRLLVVWRQRRPGGGARSRRFRGVKGSPRYHHGILRSVFVSAGPARAICRVIRLLIRRGNLDVKCASFSGDVGDTERRKVPVDEKKPGSCLWEM